jgi:F-type H+-transporting ATPase subunit b
VHSRFSALILRITLLAALAAALTAAPIRATAQQSAPAQQSASTVQPAPASVAKDAAKSEPAKPEAAPKSEQDENNVYLHAPVVKTIAKLLGLDVETAARIFEGINFAIIVLAIGIPLFRILPKVLRKRAETVRDDIESARKATEEASARLSVIEAKLSGLDGEIAQIRALVEEESKQDEARIKSTIGEESARIVASAEQEISSSAAQARRSLRHFAADLAIEQATKQLILTPESDQALIAEFLGDAALHGADGNGASKGGQN